ncbi:MAG: CHAP domain-containing protein [Gemmatimonadaceae bacterium]|jgi:hypothetical protein|nr:CHAP domain-containing protein [Gemmatimonadaceae bacterium]
MDYPGRSIKVGERDATIVRAIKAQLNTALGLAEGHAAWLDPSDGTFGPRTRQAVRLFQARHVDADGRPLRQDGEIGPVTWTRLFGSAAVPDRDQSTSAWLARVVSIAAGEVARGVREVPVNSNRGPDVEAYLRSTGTPPGSSWCAAFVYWCAQQAATQLGRANPVVRTAGCLDHWRRAPGAGARRITRTELGGDLARLRPGMFFIMDHGRGLGHTGILERIEGGKLVTLEGNTDASRTREGGGAYRLTRTLNEINKGFIDYGDV